MGMRRCRASGVMVAGSLVALLTGAAPVVATGPRQAPPNDQTLRARLAVTLVAVERLTSAQAVTRTVAPGIVAVAVDLGPDARGAAPVSTAQLRAWRRSSRRVFELAARNTRLRLRPTPVETELDESALAYVFSGSEYAAARALDIVSERVCNGREGALVIMPANDYFACYPIQHGEAERVLLMMSVIAHNAVREHSRPLTDQVFWVRRGRWISVPYEMKDDGYEYIGTPEFDLMLARLPELAP
jgi:hypothetical protein